MNYFNIDLRFIVPPLVNILLYLLLSNQKYEGNSWDSIHPMLKLGLMFFASSLLFLVVSIRFRFSLSVSAEPIRLRFGDFYFSGLLAVTLLASILFPPSVFWYAYLICVIISPWSNSIFKIVNKFLQAIPTFIITCTTSFQEEEIAHETESPVFELQPVSPRNDYFVGEQQRARREYLELIYGHA